jgi:tetratricopeptide (TPR) repeat protein
MWNNGHKRDFVLFASLVMGVMGTVSCGKVDELKAMKAMKDGNTAYQQQDYKKATDAYEETVATDPVNEDLQTSYFFLGNSYDNLWKPSKKGDPANDALLQKAVDNYQKAAEKLATAQKPSNRNIGKLALQYLVATYGGDKLNDPARAEPVVQKMIMLDPGDTTNYFALAKIYEDAGVYDEAERILQLARAAKPDDPAVYQMLAGYYNRQGQFDKTMEAWQQRAAKEPNNPEAFQTIATFYWDEAYRDARAKEAEKKEYVQKGIEAVDHALQLNPNYAEAMVYKGLLLRLEATFEKDPAKQQQLLKEADQVRDKAQEIKKQKAGN